MSATTSATLTTISMSQQRMVVSSPSGSLSSTNTTTTTATANSTQRPAANSIQFQSSSVSYWQWTNCIDDHPLALVLLQYSAAATQAATLYLLSAAWTLAQSVAWIVTVEGLDWIQTLGPMILEWDSFLLGAVFLTMSIDVDALDEQLYPTLIKNHQPPSQPQAQLPQESRSSSRSSSNSKKVTFDEQVRVLGAVANRGVTPISTFVHSDILSSTRIDPSVPMSESPIRSSSFFSSNQEGLVDSTALLARMQQKEAEHHIRTTRSGTGSPVFFESPLSSRSSSCRSSICSVSSDSSDKEAKQHRSASSRLAALFNPHAKDRGSHSGKKFVQRIMHPHHKKDLAQHQQDTLHQEMAFSDPMGSITSVSSMTSSESEYQPGSHSRRTLIGRLGLKKKPSPRRGAFTLL